MFNVDYERKRYAYELKKHMEDNDSIKIELHTTKYIHHYEFDSADDAMKLWDAIFITHWIPIPFNFSGNYYFKSGYPLGSHLPIAFKTYKAAIKTPLRCKTHREAV